MTAIRCFQCIEITVPMLLVAYHKHEIATLQEDRTRQGAGNAAVSILKGVNPREPMVEPSRFDLRTDSVVYLVPIEKPVYLLLNKFRRAVLVDRAVRSERVVGLFFPSTLQQRDTDCPS